MIQLFSQLHKLISDKKPEGGKSVRQDDENLLLICSPHRIRTKGHASEKKKEKKQKKRRKGQGKTDVQHGNGRAGQF